MLDGAGHVRIVDFGLVMELSELEDGRDPLSSAGSLPYLAPELLKYKIGGRFTDWWAVGVLTFELLTGCSPWSTMVNKKQLKKEITTFRMTAPENASKAAGDFILAMMAKSPRHRLGTRRDEDILEVPFFEGVDWAAMERGETPPAVAVHRGANEVIGHPGLQRTAMTKYLDKTSAPAMSESTAHAGLGLMSVASSPPAATASPLVATKLPPLPSQAANGDD